MKKLLLFVLLILGCYSIIRYSPSYNQYIDALNPYKDCELGYTESGDVHCHWSIKMGIYIGML